MTALISATPISTSRIPPPMDTSALRPSITVRPSAISTAPTTTMSRPTTNPPQGGLGERHVIAQRGHRRDPGGPDGGQDRGDRGHHQADAVGPRDRGPGDRELGPAEVEAELAEQPAQPEREQVADAEPDGGADEAHGERLGDHRPVDLPAGGAQGAEQRELAAALRDQDRERVDDQEDADHQRDPGEDQQERLEEAEDLVERLLVVGDVLVTGLGANARGQHRLCGVGELSCCETPSAALREIEV